MLKLIDITWLYHHLPMRFTLAVERGEQVAILGPSGAGKSTLLNLIAGFLAPASGTLLIAGDDHTLTPPSRRPVSMLFRRIIIQPPECTAKYRSGAKPRVNAQRQPAGKTGRYRTSDGH